MNTSESYQGPTDEKITPKCDACERPFPTPLEALCARLLFGGKVVCTAALTVEEIQLARSEGRMHVDAEGFGYVYIADGAP